MPCDILTSFPSARRLQGSRLLETAFGCFRQVGTGSRRNAVGSDEPVSKPEREISDHFERCSVDLSETSCQCQAATVAGGGVNRPIEHRLQALRRDAWTLIDDHDRWAVDHQCHRAGPMPKGIVNQDVDHLTGQPFGADHGGR